MYKKAKTYKNWSDNTKVLYEKLRHSDSSAIKRIALRIRNAQGLRAHPFPLLKGLENLEATEKMFLNVKDPYTVKPKVIYTKRNGLKNFKWRGTVLHIASLKHF